MLTGKVAVVLSDTADGITGQILGAGGDRISVWSQPTVVAESSRAGGSTAEAIADAFAGSLAPHLQPHGPAEASR